jgi:hypothetical protein
MFMGVNSSDDPSRGQILKRPKKEKSPNNGTARFEKCKQLLEYQYYLLFRYIWR